MHIWDNLSSSYDEQVQKTEWAKTIPISNIDERVANASVKEYWRNYKREYRQRKKIEEFINTLPIEMKLKYLKNRKLLQSNPAKLLSDIKAELREKGFIEKECVT